MKKYSQADFDKLYKEGELFETCFPSGDWSDVEFDYKAYLEFAPDCVFGDNKRFGRGCRFGKGSKFGNDCDFDEQNFFGDWCEFGDRCHFDFVTTFGIECKLGDNCTMYDYGIFNLAICSLTNVGSKNNTLSFYCDRNNDKIIAVIPNESWYSESIQDFEWDIKRLYFNGIVEEEYLAAAQFARAKFAKYKKRTG